jgi:HK97 family phage prohead protease
MDHVYFEAKMVADDTGVVSGIAWPFGSADRVGDMIEPGAFKTLSMPLPMLFGHDKNDPIGVWETATIKSDGLHLSGRLLVDDVPRAKQVFALVKAGAVPGISIGFITKKAIRRAGGGRTISSLDLFEASLVTAPMHPGARVTSAKSSVAALRLAESINRAALALAKR